MSKRLIIGAMLAAVVIFGFTGIAQCQYHIAVIYHPQIPVQGVHAIQDNAGRAGAREGGGNLLADVARFSNAKYDQFAAATKRFGDQINRCAELAIELSANATRGSGSRLRVISA